MGDKKCRFRGLSRLAGIGSGKDAAAVPRRACVAAPLIEVLEPRVLYSADLLPALVDLDESAIDGAADDNLLVLPTTVTEAVELVLINGDLEDIDTLLADFHAQQKQGRELRIHILDTQDPGVGQVESLLGRYENISQVHILSHGNQNGLQLGGSWLDHDSIGDPQSQFAQWKQHLPDDASLLFYGCDLAASASGVSFLNSLSDLTGVQVFASDDDTGHVSLKADWELEYHTGNGFYESLLSEVARANWTGQLPAGFTANDDTIGSVVSGDNLNFDSDALTANDAYSGSQPPVILSNTLPALGSLVSSGTDYTFSSTAGDSGVTSFDYRAMDGSPDLISQWRLTSDGTDDADQNNGTVTTDNAPGPLVFDGGDYVEVSNFSSLAEFTLTFDFRVNDLDNGNEEAFFSQGVWRQPNYLGVWLNGKDAAPGRHLVTEIWDSTDGDYTPFTYDVSGFEDDGLWHNYAIVVREGVGHSVYIDGSLEHSSSRADGLFNPTVPAYFGAEDIGGGMGYYLENHEINNARLYQGFDLATIQANELNEFDTATASITVRNEETLTNNNSVDVDEDMSETITSAELLIEDIEDGPGALTYEILADASHGKLVLNGTELDSGDTFTQLDINNGKLAYLHGGSETAVSDTVSLRADDGAGTATDFTFALNLNSRDDVPFIDNVESSGLSYSEGDGPVSVSDTLTLSDADDTQMQSAKVRLSTGYEVGEDVLVLAGPGPIVGSFSSGTGELLLSGTADLATWQAALRNVQYQNDSENPIESTRTIEFMVSKGSGYTVAASRVVEVTAVNDAPASGDATLLAIEEDNANPPGELVGALFDSVYTDDDGSLAGIAITADATNTEGLWQYSSDAGVSWHNVGSVSTNVALMIERTSLLRFLPDVDFYGTVPVITMHAVDGTYSGAYTDGVTRATTDLTLRGGSSPFADTESVLGSAVNAIGPADLSSGITLNTDGGNDSYLLAGDGGALLGGLSEFTVETQFQIDSLNATNALFSYNTGAGDMLKIMVRGDGGIRVGLLNVDFTSAVVPELLDGKRHSIAVSWDSDGGYLRLFVDGQFVETRKAFHVGQSIPAGGTLIMGLEQDSGVGFEVDEVFSGTLYDVRVWNEVRTPAEINEHHNQKLFVEELPASLIANWQMDGVNGAGDVVDVVSGNNLMVEHAAGAGFSTSTPITQLQVAEDAMPGDIVGSVQVGYAHRGEDLVQDGSFTQSGDTSDTVYTAGSVIGGVAGHWEVTSGNIDLHATWDESPNGGTLVDLTGSTAGSITQTIDTEPGKTYQLNFSLSGNFKQSDQHIARVTVDSGISTLAVDFTADKPNNWSVNNILWDQRSFTFTADSNRYDLTFQALTSASNGGPVVSDVSVVEVDPAIAAVLAANPSLTYNAQTHKFYQTDATIADWVAAQNNAVAKQVNGVSGRLVTIHSEYENSVVRGLANSMGQNVYIGASDQTSEGQWYWQTGSGDSELVWTGAVGGSASDSVYTNWKSGEPNNHGSGEDHAAMLYGEQNGVWNDVKLTDVTYASIVEWDAEDVVSKVVYSLESDPANAFDIDPETGEISVVDISGIDYEADPSYDITVRVTDVMGEYYEEVVTLLVTDNSSPQITFIESTVVSTTENSGPVVLTSALTLSDADDLNLQTATVSTSDLSGQDQLQFTDYGPFTGNWNAIAGELTITGDATIADWQSALRTVTYENISDDPTPGQKPVYFEVNDGNETSNTVFRMVEVTAVNDAPVLADSTLANVEEDESNPVGDTVSDIFLGNFTDVDGSLAGVAIISDSATTEGVWEYLAVGSSGWQPVGSVSTVSALVLDTNALLRFVPSNHYYGVVPELDVIGIDNSYAGSFSGAVLVYEDVSVRGATTAFTADEATVRSMVLADGPTDLSTGIQLNKDGGNDAYLIASTGAGPGGLDAVTVEVLATVDQTDKFTALLSYATVSHTNTLLVGIESDGALFAFVNGSSVYTPAGTYTMPHDGLAHSIAFSWDSNYGAVAFYIDGHLVHQEDGIATSELITAGGTLVVGQDQDTVGDGFEAGQAFQGTYHDLRLWNEARTQAEIAQTYQHKFHTDSLPDALIANWQMDGFDSSGNVVDVVSGKALSVGHASGTDYVTSNPTIEISVQEYSANGTAVGTVIPHSNSMVDDIVVDGLFTHSGATGYVFYNTGETIGAGGAWLVDSGDVNLSGDWDSTPLGGIPLDLNGVVPGTISQTLDTEIGQTYQVNFALTGNFAELSDKSMTVSAGAATESFTVTPHDGWNTANALLWNQRSFNFTATSESTILSFSGDSPNSRYGAIIGDVQVVKVSDRVADLLAADPGLEYNAGTGKFYKTVSTPVFFADARDAAVASDLNGVAGQLVTIESAYENTLVHTIAQSLGSGIWLGASDSLSEGHWHWLEGDQQGEAFWDGDSSGLAIGGAYTNWGGNEPNDSGFGEDQLSLRRDNARWNDVNSLTTYQYIIEWNADEVLSGYTFTLLSDPIGAFTVDHSSGLITVVDGSVLDYETDSSHDIVVRVTDGSGETHDDTITINVTNAPAPVLSDLTAGVKNYNENDVALIVADLIEVADGDDTHLQSATIAMTTDYQTGEDILIFPDTGTLTGVWNSSSGVLTITGNDTLAAWQDALRTVAYQNSSEDPTAGARDIEFVVYDDNEASNSIGRAHTVVSVNDSPVISDGSLNDTAEDSQSHAGQTVADLLAASMNDVDGTLVGIAVTADATTSQGQWQYSTDNGATWFARGSISEASALVLDLNTYLRFLPASNYNGVVPDLIIYAIDDTYSGSATAGASRAVTDVTTRGGSTAYSADSAAIAGSVLAVNDAPVITDGYLNDVNEDIISPTGDLIGNIFSGVLTDVDGDILGISIADNATGTEGDWQYSTAGDINWYAVGSVSESSALALDVDTRLRFVPALHFNGPVPDLKVYGLDSSTGGNVTVGNLRVVSDATTGGGDTPFSADAAVINSSVLAVNDAPQTTDSTISVIEDTPYTVAVSDFIFSDPVDGDAFTVVQIVSAPTEGELLLNGGLVFDGDSITTADIAAGRLEYKSQDDANGTAYDTFTYRVQDDGGTVNGGIDTSALALKTVDVTATNDPPSLTVGTISLLRGGIHTINNINVEAIDVDVDETQRIVSVASTPVHGALHLRGTPLNIGDTFTQAEVNAGELRYVNNGISSIDDAFALTFADVGDNANTLSVSRIVNIAVTETHPVGVTDSASVDEHQSVVIPVLDNDTAADEPIDPSSVEIVAPPAYGLATVNANNEIEYTHDGGETTVDSLTYRVADVGGDVSEPATVSLVINPVNDIPILDSFSGPPTRTNEDSTVEITAAELASQIIHNDAEDGTLNRFRVTGLTSGLLFIGVDQATANPFVPGSNDVISNTLHAFWTPEANESGLLTAFSVQGLDSDDALSVDSLTIDVEVMPVNDAPVTGAGDAVLAADETYTFGLSDFIFSDPVESDTLQSVRIDSLPVAGQLLLWESPVNIGDELAVTDIAAGELRYVPLPATDTATTTFDFRVRDSGGTDNGASDLSLPSLFTLTITPGEIPGVTVDENLLPFQVSENTPAGSLVGDLSALKPDAIFFHQRGGDFAGGDQSQAGFNRYSADGSDLGATLDQWQVGSGSVDLRGPAWAAGPGGGFALDMNGAEPGQISQQIATVPGAQYVIKFNLSGNFLKVPDDGKVSVEVSAAGDQSEFDFEHVTGWSKSDLHWREQSMIFTATGPDTTVAFAASSSGAYGALITDIEVIDVLSYQLVDNTLPFDVVGDNLVVAGDLNHEWVDNYPLQIVASNSVFDSVVVNVPVDVLDKNESPSLMINEPLALIAGQTAVIGIEHLSANDVDIQDSTGSSMSYTLTTLPDNGLIHLDNVELGLGDSFTQADLEQAKLSFTDTGLSAFTDRFEFLLEDGGEDGVVGSSAVFDIDIHNPLSLSVATDWSLLEGGSLTLTDQHISRTDGLIDNSDLRIDVASLSDNFSVQSAADSTVLDNFTQQDVISGNVLLAHDGSNRHGGELQLMFTRLDDGTSPVVPQLINLTALDVADAPVGSNSSLATDHTTPLTINTQQLMFDDGDDGGVLAGIEIVGLPASGALQVSGNAALPGDVISAEDIDAAQLLYMPDPAMVGELTESVTYRLVDDGDTGTGGSNRSADVYAIEFTVRSDHPPQARPDSVFVAEGETIAYLSSGAVSLIENDLDLDTTATGLLVDLETGPLHGELLLNADGTFSYAHDGGESRSDSFSYRVVDSPAELNGGEGSIGLVDIDIAPRNDAPTAGVVPDEQVIASQELRIELPQELFTDVDTNDNLTLTATLSNGSALPVWLKFDSFTGDFSGTPGARDIGSLDIVVTATDSAGEGAQSELKIIVEPRFDAAFAAVPEVSPEPQATATAPPEIPEQTQAVVNVDPVGHLTPKTEAQNSRPGTTIDEDPIAYTINSNADVTLDLTFVDLVVKHERPRIVNAPVEQVIQTALPTSDAVVELQQLFFTANDGASKMAKSMQKDLNQVREELSTSVQKEKLVVSGAISLSAGFSIGYVIFLIRGGLLLTSVLASMPAWRVIDPVPVLAAMSDDEDDEDAESLESIVDENDEPEDSTENQKPSGNSAKADADKSE